MDRKILSLIIGAIIGAVALGACGQANIIWIIAGAFLGAVFGLVVILSQAQMKKDRETGLDS